MVSQNLNLMIADLKAMEVSDDFVRGALFLFAATLMWGPSAQACHSWEQWLFEHAVDEVADDLLGRMDDVPLRTGDRRVRIQAWS